MMLTTGARLGPYEIVGPLGAGGMGEVYKARDTRLDRTVAVKILPADVAGDPVKRKRFQREARAISSLTHPHICTLYDVGEQDGIDFFVMEHLTGETLAQRLLRGALPLDEVLRIGAQLADALDAAHRQGVIHRDLKPANVMLTASGAKILDFGLAKWHGIESDAAFSMAASANPTLTQVGTVVGTIQYMSPEQVEGKPADTRSDLFALGAILYECTTGKKAFEGTSPASVMSAIRSTSPAPLATVAPMTPPTLGHLVARCLAKSADERWQTAKDLLEELKWTRESRSHSLEPARRAMMTTRERVAWGSLVVALAVAVATGAALLVRRTPAETLATTFAISPPRDAAFGATSEWRNRAGNPFSESFVAISPNGRSLAFVATAAGASSSLWIRNLNSLEAESLPGTDEARMPFWSPDSRIVGFFAQGKLKTIALPHGPLRVVCDAPAGEGGAWNSDGTILFAPSPTSALFRVSAAGGSQPVPVTTLDRTRQEVSHRWPTFLPDGRHFLFLVHQPAAIAVSSLDGTTTKRLVPADSKALYGPPGYLLFARQHSIVAQRFDPARLELTGDPYAIFERVQTNAALGHADFSVADNDTLAYQMVDTVPVRLTWFTRAGRQLVTIGEPMPAEWMRLSPDERLVALVESDSQLTRNIWLADVRRGVQSRFTFDQQGDSDPAWSPDGRQVAFTSERRGAGSRDLHVKDASNGKEEILLESAERKVPNDWSSDGRFLAYNQVSAGESGGAGGIDVWILPLSGARKPFPFLVSPYYKSNARFSPDGRWLAYASDESGRFEIYVEPFPGRGDKIRISTTGGTQPLWRKDGKELFYLAPDGSLTAVAIKGTSALEPGIPTPLFRAPLIVNPVLPQYAVADNGQRFLFLVPVGASPPAPITVVLNWSRVIKQ